MHRKKKNIKIHRRTALKIGVAAAAFGTVSSLLNFNEKVQAQTNINVPNLSAKMGYRIANYVPAAGTSRLGLVTEDGKIYDIGAEAKIQKVKLDFDSNSLISLASSGNIGLQQIDKIFKGKGKASAEINQVKLLSPIPKPQSNIYCVGWNYLEHFEEGKEARADKGVTEYPKYPVFFSKGTQTMNEPFGNIPYDASYSTMEDWEAELAVIIGKKGKNISEKDAMEYVFGYSAYNDTTVRDVQQKRHSGQWFKGKSIDGHGPMGPWVVTAGGLNLDETRIICRVNGVEKQNGSYKQMYFKIPTIISELSRGLTLLPGDIIATGTPPGVGYSRTPAEFLKPGDVMETEVTGIGLLRNKIG